MAKIKATRSIRGTQPSRLKKQSPRSPRRSATPVRRKPQTATPSTSPSGSELALQEKTLPSRRFVEFPLARGRVTEKVQLFLEPESQSLTIEFQDRTSLYLELQPSLIVNAQFQKEVKGDLETLAEWPAIRSGD